MKRLINRLICMSVLLSLLLSLPARAEEMWSEEYYRVYDSTGTLTDAENEALDELSVSFLENYQLDVVMMTMTAEDYEGSLEEEATDFYFNNGFGYGKNQDGWIMAFDADRSETAILAFGAAEGMIPESYFNMLEELIAQNYGKYESYGSCYTFQAGLMQYLQDDLGYPPLTEETETAAAGQEDVQNEAVPAETESTLASGGIERVGKDSNLPYWYPADPEKFSFYNDAEASRVVDDADIFSEEQEASMKARIAEITESSGKDIVVFTDTSAYGFDHGIYAVDFYDYNGYGIGPENEGIVLMICMDPEDRGWWAAATGPESRGLLNEDNLNSLDDVLYEYMVNGAYGEGVLNWIENVGTMYKKGVPFAPDWYPDLEDEFVWTAQPDRAKVVDDAGVLSDAELQSLNQKADEMSERLSKEIVVHFAANDYNLGIYGYANRYYYYNGYGYGEDSDGILLTVYTDSHEAMMAAFGSGSEHLSEVNEIRLTSRVESIAGSGKYFEAADNWMDRVAGMERTGRVPRSIFSWCASALLGLVLGMVYGSIQLARAKKKMITVRLSMNADDFVDGTPNVRLLSSTVIGRNTVVWRTESTSSGGGSTRSSSSGSSYRSSYSGSSGRSHSGGGRRF